MQKDAQEHAAEDKKKRELVEARNEADTRCYQLEKLVKDQGEKLGDSDKTSLEAAMEKVRAAAKEDDVEAIRAAIQEMETASHAMSEALYKAAADDGASAAAGGDAADGAAAEADDDAIDAEFEVKS